ncbi:MAG: hypothetical protein ACRDCE_22790 [Cetobacterium sp.]|uniref:hypothetical protein n=1 Tax=Cetobacterium sp. TaxID=2071632 RepID=UPI003EE49C65
MALTTEQRGMYAKELMADAAKAGKDLDLALALAQVDEMDASGAFTEITDEREDSFEGVGQAEEDPFAGVGVVEDNPFEGVGMVEEVAPAADWSPIKAENGVPNYLSGPESFSDSSAIQEGFQATMNPLLRGAEVGGQYLNEKVSEAEAQAQEQAKLASPYFPQREDKNADLFALKPSSYWGPAPTEEVAPAEMTPEVEARMANANQTVSEATTEQDKTDDGQTWQKIVDARAKNLYVSGEAKTIPEAREMARKGYDADVAEGITSIALMFLPGLGAAMLPAYAARFAALPAAAKYASLIAYGASENTAAGIVGNWKAGRPLDEGLFEDAALGAGAAAAVPLLSQGVKYATKGLSKGLQKVGGDSAVGDLGRAIDIPSKPAREIAEAQPKVAELEAQVLKEQSALQNRYLNELENVPSGSDIRRTNLDEATIEGAYPGYTKMVKQMDEATAAKDEAIATLRAQKEEATSGMFSTSTRKSQVAKQLDEQIATVESRYADDVSRIEREYSDNLNTLTRDRDDMRDYLDRDDDAIRDALSIDFLNKSDSAYNTAMRGEKVLGDMNASDFVAMRNKMRMVEEVNKKGGMVGTGTVAKQLTKGGKASEFMSDARTGIESLAGSVSDRSKWMADATGLRTPGVETARKTAVNEIADDFLDNIDSLRYSGKVKGGEKVEEALDYLRRRVESTKKGDVKGAAKIEKDFDKHYDTLRTAGVKPETINELGLISGDLKTLRKTAQDITKDVSEDKSAGWAGMAAGVGIDVLTGTPGASTLVYGFMGKVGQWLGKAGLNKWVSKSAKGRFDELNKAFKGQLVWNKEIEALIESGATPAKVVTYMVMTEAVDPSMLEM